MTCEMTVLARVGGNLWPCVFWAMSCTPSVGETPGFAYLETCVHFCLLVFPVLCLWTSLDPLVGANDGSTEVRRVAPAVGLSAFAVEDAGPSIVGRRKLPAQARVDHRQC